MKLSTIYRRAAALIAPEGAWGQGFYESKGARCAVGALTHVGESPLGQWPSDSWRWPQHQDPNETSLARFNDDPSTTQDDVVTYLLLAAEALRSEGR